MKVVNRHVFKTGKDRYESGHLVYCHRCLKWIIINSEEAKGECTWQPEPCHVA